MTQLVWAGSLECLAEAQLGDAHLRRQTAAREGPWAAATRAHLGEVAHDRLADLADQRVKEYSTASR